MTEEVPRGLEGEGDMDVDANEARFERRRERESKRAGSKRKGVKVKDKDWILKKKEVGLVLIWCSILCSLMWAFLLDSCIDNVERKTSLAIRSLRVANGEFNFDYSLLPVHCCISIIFL